jgi:hypothetical protein
MAVIDMGLGMGLVVSYLKVSFFGLPEPALLLHQTLSFVCW